MVIRKHYPPLKVAPRAGAWIETGDKFIIAPYLEVAPRAGAWIETFGAKEKSPKTYGRAPRGRVD